MNLSIYLSIVCLFHAVLTAFYIDSTTLSLLTLIVPPLQNYQLKKDIDDNRMNCDAT